MRAGVRVRLSERAVAMGGNTGGRRGRRCRRAVDADTGANGEQDEGDDEEVEIEDARRETGAELAGVDWKE